MRHYLCQALISNMHSQHLPESHLETKTNYKASSAVRCAARSRVYKRALDRMLARLPQHTSFIKSERRTDHSHTGMISESFSGVSAQLSACLKSTGRALEASKPGFKAVGYWADWQSVNAARLRRYYWVDRIRNNDYDACVACMARGGHTELGRGLVKTGQFDLADSEFFSASW